MTQPPAILVFVRAPVRGAVKTRLAAAVGAEGALRAYRRAGAHVLAQARRVPAHLRVHYTPAGEAARIAEWLGGDLELVPQVDGELGTRLAAAVDQAVAAGFRAVLLVGADLPGLSATHLERALHLLAEHDVVLGPARDGGYWLIGLKQAQPLFEGVPWGSGDVCRATRERIAAAGLTCALLPELRDLDVAADLPPGWLDWLQAADVQR